MTLVVISQVVVSQVVSTNGLYTWECKDFGGLTEIVADSFVLTQRVHTLEKAGKTLVSLRGVCDDIGQ